MADSSKSELRWMNGVHVNAKRKPDQEWEEHKEDILEKYKTHTLEDVMRYMEEEHDFIATKRQYIHRMEKWGIKKYNTKTGKPSVASAPTACTSKLTPSREPKTSGRRPQNRQPIPQSSFQILQEQSQVVYDDENIDPLLYEDMSSQDVKYWYSLLADMLYALGDSQSAFQIRARLYQYYPDVSLAVACGRSAQAKFQIGDVRDIIEKAINNPEVRDGSWIKFLFGAQLARTWDQVGDKENAFEQFEALVNKSLNLETSQHRQMVTRGPELDVVAYSHLRHLILQFNKDDYNFEEGEKRLEVDKFLQNFLQHQPWASLRNISCLSSCLKWCVDVLEANSALTGPVQNIPQDPVYKIVCLLWRTWMLGLQQQPQRVSPEWAERAMQQLGIPASELLTLVICMIMATSLPAAKAKGQQSDSTVADVIRRANELKKIDDNALLDRFLFQVRRSADQRMASREEKVYLIRSSEFQPVRDFVATCVPEYIKLPAAHSGYIYPLLVAGPVQEEPARQTPSPPVPSLFPTLVEFQHGESC